MQTTFFKAGAILGMLAIILGAFGAHALKVRLEPEQLVAFETGVKYQMYHALFLLFVGLAPVSARASRLIFNLVIAGVVLFSGSIYLLSTQAVTGINIKPFGFVTPIGGLLLIIAWIGLFVDFIRKKS